MFRCTSVLLGALLIIGSAIPLAAKPLLFDQQKCQIEVPDQWTEQQVDGDQAAYINADQTKSFVLRVVATGTRVTLDDAAFVKGFEDSVISHSGVVVSRKHETVAGLDAYTLETRETVPTGTAENATTVFLADGFAYGLARSKLNASPTDDAELSGIVGSFQFIGEPQLHQSAGDNLAYRLGQLVGAGLTVALVLLAIRWLRRRKRAGR